jgi:hypothetical protein
MGRDDRVVKYCDIVVSVIEDSVDDEIATLLPGVDESYKLEISTDGSCSIVTFRTISQKAQRFVGSFPPNTLMFSREVIKIFAFINYSIT